jgi:hypothetical protein
MLSQTVRWPYPAAFDLGCIVCIIADTYRHACASLLKHTLVNRCMSASDGDIVQEEIHDLLLESNEEQPNISLREMPNGSMCIAGAREVEVDLSRGASASLEFVMNILLRGSMSRATSMTMMNARSSRSHAVFSLMLEQRKGGSGGGGDSQEDGDGPDGSRDGKEADMSYLCAKMLLVDLAGSERAKRTQATGARLQEGIHINQGIQIHACH